MRLTARWGRWLDRPILRDWFWFWVLPARLRGAIAMASETRQDPERIYLEPAPYSPEVRMWCEDGVWQINEGLTSVEYIRADLHAAEIARLTAELEESRRERSAARAEALTAQASLRRVERELEEARERERGYREALMTISTRCYEAVMQTPLLEHQSMHALAGACKQDADAALAGQSALTEGET